MRNYGKKNSVDLNPMHYNIVLLGESGIGKTTIVYQMCKKLCGDDGYLHFDIGRECGAAAIEGIVSEPIEDWAKLNEVVDEIVENKTTDYADMQVVIWDTFDELVILAEKEAIRQHNKKNPDKKVDTINSVAGGFGRGQDKAIELILDAIWKLKGVGISSVIISHVKRSDVVDPLTQESYSKITADTQQKYFNAIKNKMAFVALAYIDRNIVTQKTGRKDIKGNDITTNKVVSEARVINFRDDTYAVDSKSRFADIVDKIPFDADTFIKAMQDAIIAEKTKGGKSIAEAEEEQKARDKNSAKAAAQYSKNAKANKIDIERNEDIIADIRSRFADAPEEVQNKVKETMKAVGISNFRDAEVPTEALESILAVLG